MKFKPFGDKYNFKEDVLIKTFPEYLRSPIENWLWKVLGSVNLVETSDYYLSSGKRYIKQTFIHRLQIYFREVFPHYWSEAIPYIFEDPNRTANFLALCLQNFADGNDAGELEYILSQGGSAYEVTKTQKDVNDYARGAYDLLERVSSILKEQSAKALSESDILQEAWRYCYSRNPDYEKVVSRSCDFLENFFGKLYFPKDPKPQLIKFIHAFEQNATMLSYKGDSITKVKSNLTSLLGEATNIRGQHTKGKGRKPTKEEAEFILHTTIYIWNLHQR